MYKGGPLDALSHEAKFKQDAKPRSIYSVRTEWVDELGRNMYVHTYMHTYMRQTYMRQTYMRQTCEPTHNSLDTTAARSI